jgi:hypothetical protein
LIRVFEDLVEDSEHFTGSGDNQYPVAFFVGDELTKPRDILEV